ncbi:MAG: hypothetical protein OEM64_04100 [Gammaproteobacteria bacterium]|nr:hypothetical protein [Gammaproteobacteria bacterium]
MSIHKPLLILPLVIALGGCTMLQPSEDPVLIKLTELERRLATTERIVDNQSLAQMTQQLDALERRVDQMQGVAETLEHEAGSTADRQRQLYADLDSRIQDLESTLSARGAAGSRWIRPG